MRNELDKYTPKRRVFTPAENSSNIWPNRQIRKKVLPLIIVGNVALISASAGFVVGLNVQTASEIETPDTSTAPTSPAIPENQPENSPQKLAETDFINLFVKLSTQSINTKEIIDKKVIWSFYDESRRHLLSGNATTTQFSGKLRRGIQRSIIIDSQDNSKSIALSAHLQGKGVPPASADIRVLKVLMINRSTKQIKAFWFSDLKEGALTVFESSSPPNFRDLSFWEKGEAFHQYIPEIGIADMEDLSTVVQILKNGKVNIDLTQKSVEKLDRKYNSGTDPITPLKPQPTPGYF